MPTPPPLIQHSTRCRDDREPQEPRRVISGDVAKRHRRAACTNTRPLRSLGLRSSLRLFLWGGALASVVGCVVGEPDKEVDEFEEEEEPAEVESEIELPEPLPFEDCPEADQLNSIDMNDFDFSGSTGTFQGTYYRCGTWGIEENSEECYTDTVEVIAGIEEYFLDMALDYVGGFGNVSCDSEIDIACGPIYPEAVYETFDDDKFRCCFLAEIDVTCSL